MQNSELSFREILVHSNAGESGPTARLVRMLRRRIPGDWEPTEQNSKAIAPALVKLWKRLWNKWRKDHPAPEAVPNELDDGLAYYGVFKTSDGYRAEFRFGNQKFKRFGFPTAQAAARFHDEMRRKTPTLRMRLNFPTEEEKRPPRVLRPATIRVKPVKQPAPLRTDVPGARHGVVIQHGCITAVHAGKYLGSFKTIRDAKIAYNTSVLNSPRHSVGKPPILNYIEPLEAAA